MTGDDKLFVVILVMFMIFLGLGVYLYMLDRKLTRIEKKQEEIRNQQLQ
ncbi:MAG: CcmD family protein [Lentimicrobium sp.]|jgi:CcmD family protein|nr:CcmD family protein [Lentimicrobium sp.]